MQKDPNYCPNVLWYAITTEKNTVCLIVSICQFSNPSTKEPHTRHFCSWSLRNTNCLSPSLSFFQKQTLSLWLAYTHTVLLHLHSRSTQSSSHSIKPEDRCWISFLEEKSSAPFIGVELAWRAGEAGAPWEEGTGKKCVYACAFVCQRMQPSHPIYWEEEKGLLAKLAPVIGDPGVARSEAWLAVATWWQLLASHPVYTHIQAHFHTHRETNAHLDV